MSKKPLTEIQSLRRRWYDKTGEDMPAEIASLSIEKIRKAVDWTEKGITVVVPPASVAAEVVEVSSIMTWDNHGQGS